MSTDDMVPYLLKGEPGPYTLERLDRDRLFCLVTYQGGTPRYPQPAYQQLDDNGDPQYWYRADQIVWIREPA